MARRRADTCAGRSHALRGARRARMRSSRAPPGAPTAVRRGGAGGGGRWRGPSGSSGRRGVGERRDRQDDDREREARAGEEEGVGVGSRPPGPRQRRGEPGLGKQAQTRLGAVEPGERGEAAEAAEQAHEHTQEHAGLEEYGRALPESSEQALESEERRGGGPGQGAARGRRARHARRGRTRRARAPPRAPGRRAPASPRCKAGSPPALLSAHAAGREARRPTRRRGPPGAVVPARPGAAPPSGRGGWRAPRARSRARRTPRGPGRRAAPPPPPASRAQRRASSPRGPRPRAGRGPWLRRGGVRTWGSGWAFGGGRGEVGAAGMEPAGGAP